jgi:hypothetical protein
MNLFLILIPQSLNSQFLNLAPYNHYNEDGVQKSELVLISNNEICKYIYFYQNMELIFSQISIILHTSAANLLDLLL